MDAFGILGFVFGSTGMTFGFMAWGQMASLSKEVEELKKCLQDSGILTERLEPES